MKESCIEQCQAYTFKKISGNEGKQKQNQHNLEENAEQWNGVLLILCHLKIVFHPLACWDNYIHMTQYYTRRLPT